MTNRNDFQPRYAPIPLACKILGFQRTKMYELAGAGAIRIVKVGGRSVVDMAVALAFMATLPLANIAKHAASDHK